MPCMPVWLPETTIAAAFPRHQTEVESNAVTTHMTREPAAVCDYSTTS